MTMINRTYNGNAGILLMALLGCSVLRASAQTPEAACLALAELHIPPSAIGLPTTGATGYLYAAAAFILWGVLPVFWKQLDTIPAPQLVAHRVCWSTLVLLPLATLTGHGAELWSVFRSPQRLFRQALAAVFVGANWLGFVWAITNGRMIESSLGYFLNPLLSVLLGVVLLGERLRPLQWAAVAIAAVGVVFLAGQYQRFPWIALFLAGSFCLYGLAKKKTSLSALSSLTVETLLLFTPAAFFL
ncbi:MAG: EamA family transporter RarD, partial [Planctomycetia bacterium]|nr:EamA family transporter RarD [Planctomycetia bacterium]